MCRSQQAPFCRPFHVSRRGALLKVDGPIRRISIYREILGRILYGWRCEVRDRGLYARQTSIYKDL